MSRPVHCTARTSGTPLSRGSVWKCPHIQILDPSVGFVPTYYTTPFLMFHLYSFFSFSLRSCSLGSVLQYMIDSCMSPPEWTHDPSGAQSSRSRPYKAPSYKSKHDTPSPLFMLISFVLSHSLSLMDDVSHLLTVLATLPGAW